MGNIVNAKELFDQFKRRNLNVMMTLKGFIARIDDHCAIEGTWYGNGQAAIVKRNGDFTW